MFRQNCLIKWIPSLKTLFVWKSSKWIPSPKTLFVWKSSKWIPSPKTLFVLGEGQGVRVFRMNSTSLRAQRSLLGVATHRVDFSTFSQGDSWGKNWVATPCIKRRARNDGPLAGTAILHALCLLFFFFSLPTFALPEDSKEKMIIKADYSTYNFKTGLSTYKGHVLVDQGSTHLTADLLITKSHHRQIQEATAYGQKQLAHYWTLPKPNDALINAHAEVIHFYPSQSLVRLEKNVLIQQEENRLQGQIILYDTKNQTITAPSLKNTQAVLVYQSDSGENH